MKAMAGSVGIEMDDSVLVAGMVVLYVWMERRRVDSGQ
jgi:hypothetical protein